MAEAPMAQKQTPGRRSAAPGAIRRNHFADTVTGDARQAETVHNGEWR
jgi:hypothetical protein